MLKTKENQTIRSMNLSQRYQEILSLLITDYIATSGAIGSRQISKKIMRRLSPATIRNVMADLEELGYLKQPHTSAGRIPTEKGLRYYVDTLVEQRPLTESEKKCIQDHYHSSEKNIRTLMRKTSQVLATLSQYAGLVLTPRLEKTVFKHMEFLPLSHGRVLGIFVSQTGMVENRILEVSEELNFRDLEKINNYCNACFLGLTLEDAREKVAYELSQVHQEYDKLLSKALLFSQELLGGIQSVELVVEGEIQLLETKEFSTMEQAKELMKVLEEKNQLLKVLDSCLESPGVRIFIGNESHCEGTKNLSLIAATYTKQNRVLGSIGVIGPTRMDYAKVIPIVDFTAKLVSDILDLNT